MTVPWLLALIYSVRPSTGALSAEQVEPQAQCEDNKFTCANGRCIPFEWRCDRDNDCGDAGVGNGSLPSDEANCAYTGSAEPCLANQFECHNGGDHGPASCISLAWKCDGDIDCQDQSDETGCDKLVECEADTQFDCGQHPVTRTPICIPASWKCDGQEDCYDGRDEKQCTTTVPSSAASPLLNRTCKHDEFTCDNGRCIFNQWVCDHDDDCNDQSDEKNCTTKQAACNKNTQFTCVSNGYCILREWMCDGEGDCIDRSDEHNCTGHVMHTPARAPCHEDSFRCVTSAECFPSSWRCDGDPDCADGSDEEDCAADKHQCMPEDFACATGPSAQAQTSSWHSAASDAIVFVALVGTGKLYTDTYSTCIRQDQKCDGIVHCPLGDDESADTCPVAITVSPSNCSTGQFDCVHSDFSSAMHVCIDERYVCDGTPHCPIALLKQLPHRAGYDPKVAPDEDPLMCGKGGHVNGDSGEDSDEDDDASTPTVTCDAGNGGCQHICIPLPGHHGRICSCRRGFTLHNETHCEDIDECSIFGTCSHICENHANGSYACKCYAGYQLKPDNRTCVTTTPGDVRLLLTNRASIKEVNLRRNEARRMADDLGSAIAIDYLFERKKLIWTDVFHEAIFMCDLPAAKKSQSGLRARRGHLLYPADIPVPGEVDDETQTVECNHTKSRIFHRLNSSPDGLAVDWVHNLLFWTDTGFNQIHVMTLNDSHRDADNNLWSTVLHREGLDEPRALVVDPQHGLIFWSDWGDQSPKIERSGMDGADRVIIVQESSQHVQWPNGLAVDLLAQRIYWADAKLKEINSVDYDGQHLHTIVHSHQRLKHPFSLSIFEEKMYWSDWDTHAVYEANKFTGLQHKEVLKVTHLMSVKVYHPTAQPQHSDKCDRHNCLHLCLPKSHWKREQRYLGLPYSCKCADSYDDRENGGRSCQFSGGADANALDRPDDAPLPQTGSIALSSFVVMLLIAVAFTMAGYVFYRRYESRIMVPYLGNFDNPVYRNTTTIEDDAQYFDEGLRAAGSGWHCSRDGKLGDTLSNFERHGGAAVSTEGGGGGSMAWSSGGGGRSGADPKLVVVTDDTDDDDDDDHNNRTTSAGGAIVYTDRPAGNGSMRQTLTSDMDI